MVKEMALRDIFGFKVKQKWNGKIFSNVPGVYIITDIIIVPKNTKITWYYHAQIKRSHGENIYQKKSRCNSDSHKLWQMGIAISANSLKSQGPLALNILS